jgi:transcriptional regulator with GAF, ATPase, and Fis domain
MQIFTERGSVDDILDTFVRGMITGRPRLGRVCVWMAESGPQGPWLRLVASGRPPGELIQSEWRLEDGDFNRIPFTEPLIGQVAEQATPRYARDEVAWFAYPRWARDEGIFSFYAAPLCHEDAVLGVLATFHRYRYLDPQVHETTLIWSRIFAEFLGGALAAARSREAEQSVHDRLVRENAYLRRAERRAGGYGEIVGRSSAMRRIRDQVRLAAPSPASVLVSGEAGTGRSLVARSIHLSSPRKERLLIQLEARDDAGIEDRLTEALDLARWGSLFIRNVGALPRTLQLRLLRRIQGVTDDRERPRIIAGTEPAIRDAVETGRFDPDLMNRLSTLTIDLPPLRERPEDIHDLVQYFLTEAGRGRGRPAPRPTRTERQALERYPWPGNVTELRSAVERAVLTAGDGPLRFDPGRRPSGRPRPPATVRTDEEIREMERQNLVRALEEAGWKVSGPTGAAALLGLKPTTLAARMKARGISRPRP